MTIKPGAAHEKARPGRLRIVAGKWRSRLLQIAAVDGLRPTSERIRETLFNWLSPTLEGARCLDLFAGSGALGFEAASRGAAEVVCVEQNPVLDAAMQALKMRLAADAVTVQRDDALRWLARNNAGGDIARFDIVFVDPPFDANVLLPVLGQLARMAISAGSAERMLVYVERARDAAPLPAKWQPLREGTTREVAYGLYRLQPDAAG